VVRDDEVSGPNPHFVTALGWELQAWFTGQRSAAQVLNGGLHVVKSDGNCAAEPIRESQ